MKTLLPLLTLFCLLTFSSSAVIAPQEVLKDGCCSDHSRVLVPKDKIKHVAMVDSGCPVKAVIITTKTGKQFCLDPALEWTKKRLAEFEAA